MYMISVFEGVVEEERELKSIGIYLYMIGGKVGLMVIQLLE